VPWLVLVPRRFEVTELHALNQADRRQMMDEIALASRIVEKLFRPDKINIGALGNIVPQLHIHVIGRFKNDPAWPQPVWGRLEPNPYSVQALKDIRQRIKEDALWP
jgi:diadenosine tetraphosphate (Ap4A) HIT family hydrolase